VARLAAQELAHRLLEAQGAAEDVAAAGDEHRPAVCLTDAGTAPFVAAEVGGAGMELQAVVLDADAPPRVTEVQPVLDAVAGPQRDLGDRAGKPASRSRRRSQLSPNDWAPGSQYDASRCALADPRRSCQPWTSTMSWAAVNMPAPAIASTVASAM
jgi:hypothetical protein